MLYRDVLNVTRGARKVCFMTETMLKIDEQLKNRWKIMKNIKNYIKEAPTSAAGARKNPNIHKIMSLL